MNRTNRRQLLATAFAGMAAAARAQEEPAIPGKRPLIVHNDRPEDLETPNKDLETWLTPNDAFFVRHHLPRPTVDMQSYRLAVNGLVGKPLSLSLDDLRKFPQSEVVATLECAGNGRDFYRPRVPGIQWKRGGIGNAEWRGPRLADILKLAGAKMDAPFVETDGADTGVAKTPDFIRSMPMRKALDTPTLLALDMNGEPIPEFHGCPARLIAPGWDGASWVKWVVSFTVAAAGNKAFYMNPAYRYPKYALAPGNAPVPAELEVIEGMPVKSSITTPAEQDRIALGPLTIRGFAWAGEQKVMRVDISTDGGSRWSPAELTPQNLNFAWRIWSYRWTPPRPGFYTILSRATDSTGRVQPIVAEWNPSGYLWNAIDRVGIVVEKSA